MSDNNDQKIEEINNIQPEPENAVDVPAKKKRKKEKITVPGKKDFHSSFFDIIRTVFGALVMAGLLNCFIFQVVAVCQTSMVPTFEDKNRVFLCKCAYWFEEPVSGDIVVFRTDARPDNLIKRVIGLPGDMIEISNGIVKRNGKELDEPYINGGTGNTRGSFYCIVPEGSYFCVGDNRNVSIDCRDPEIGCIPMSDIKGKVLFCISPLHKVTKYDHSFADKE